MSVNDSDERLETAFDPQARRDEDARRLEASLADTARKLGMKVRVVADSYSFCFHVSAWLLSPNGRYTVDEDILLVPQSVPQSVGSTALAELMARALESLQLKLHDNMAVAMQKTDVRKRQYTLSKEDKETLHRMYMDACNEALRDFSRAEEGRKRTDKYRELMSRLFR